MLKVSVDEGVAFDLLAILEVKIKHADSQKKRDISSQSYLNLYHEIAAQLRTHSMEDILNSVEYTELVKANLLTFKLVDQAREAKDGLAKEVDEANLLRYNRKASLQRRFFNSQPTEIKTKI